MTVQGVHEEFLRNEANGKYLNDLDRHRIDAREHRKTFTERTQLKKLPSTTSLCGAPPKGLCCHMRPVTGSA